MSEAVGLLGYIQNKRKTQHNKKELEIGVDLELRGQARSRK